MNIMLEEVRDNVRYHISLKIYDMLIVQSPLRNRERDLHPYQLLHKNAEILNNEQLQNYFAGLREIRYEKI
jgi:hypothetical protein